MHVLLVHTCRLANINTHRMHLDPETDSHACMRQPLRPRAQPRLLPQLLQQLGRSNPSLLALINSNQADFVRLVNEPVSEADLEESLRQSQEHAERARAANTVQVTQAEMQQIERLEQLVGPMGLDRQAVLEAWLACDKNEELAANYLLNNLEDILNSRFAD